MFFSILLLASSVLAGPAFFSTDFIDSSTRGYGNQITDNQAAVTIDVFGESLCPDTTRFLKNQLVPLWQKYGSTGNIDIHYHPFGLARASSCVLQGDEYSCKCHHGESECVLNRLQACVIDMAPQTDDHLDLVTCIQQKYTLYNAVASCIPPSNKKLNGVDLCANSRLGKKLMAQHGDIQNRLNSTVTWVPWIVINGQRESSAEYHLEDVVCSKYMKC